MKFPSVVIKFCMIEDDYEMDITYLCKWQGKEHIWKSE